jgi:hypothetical protein
VLGYRGSDTAHGANFKNIVRVDPLKDFASAALQAFVDRVGLPAVRPTLPKS